MLTQFCILKFTDGAEVTGRVCAVSPYDNNVVEYSGATGRLHDRVELASPADLRLLFRNEAKELGAEYRESFEGQYDYAE